MPYKKPFKAKKKRFPRSKRNASLALKAYRMAKRATNTMELHKTSVLGFNTRAGYDHLGNHMSGVAEGDLSSTREGLRIWARSIRINYECKWNATANGCDETVRILVVRDKLYQGTAPTTALILQEVSTYSTLSQRNNELEGKRFIFLYDRIHRNPNQVSTDTYSAGKRLIIPLKFPIHYTGSTSTSTDCGKNALWFFAIGDQSVASGNCPDVRVSARLYFDP